MLEFLIAAEVSVDPMGALLNYGAIGILAVLLLFAVKKLDDRATKNFDERLAEKDEIIDRLMVLLEMKVIPAMSKSSQVIQASTNKESALIDRLDAVLSQIESRAADGQS